MTRCVCALIAALITCSCGTRHAATVQTPSRPQRAESAPVEPLEPACEVTADTMVMEATSPPAWLTAQETQGPCEMDGEGRLRKGEDAEPYSELDMATGSTPFGPFTVTFTGPHGSGRLWDVGVSYRSSSQLAGFCFLTSTVAWRNVGGVPGLREPMFPLIEWVQDVDNDGAQEFVVRSSFPLFTDAADGDHGMTVSAYDRSESGFTFDAESTRTLRLRLAATYKAAQSSNGLRRDTRESFGKAATLLRAAACAEEPPP